MGLPCLYVAHIHLSVLRTKWGIVAIAVAQLWPQCPFLGTFECCEERTWPDGTEVRQVGHRQRKRAFELLLSVPQAPAPDLDPATWLQASEGWSHPSGPAGPPAMECQWWTVASPVVVGTVKQHACTMVSPSRGWQWGGQWAFSATTFPHRGASLATSFPAPAPPAGVGVWPRPAGAAVPSTDAPAPCCPLSMLPAPDLLAIFPPCWSSRTQQCWQVCVPSRLVSPSLHIVVPYSSGCWRGHSPWPEGMRDVIKFEPLVAFSVFSLRVLAEGCVST